MKKYAIDMRVAACERLNDAYALLKLEPCEPSVMPADIVPGQFVQVQVPDSPGTFLRRPISINFVDYDTNQLWLLVREAGDGTRHLTHSSVGQVINMLLPLGNGFTLPADTSLSLLLVGGGVGVAPLLYLGKKLGEMGHKVRFALGARSVGDLLMYDEFCRYGEVFVSTEDGSMGEQGFITTNTVFDTHIDHIACCGPTPMMRAVASIAAKRDIACEVSLENMMACGLGACLCCVEDTTDGNVCVCTEGPVFNIKRLKWNL